MSTKGRMMERLNVILAGRAAEEVRHSQRLSSNPLRSSAKQSGNLLVGSSDFVSQLSGQLSHDAPGIS